MTDTSNTQNSLQILHDADNVFIKPVKRINEGEDVFFFLSSRAYTDIWRFLLQLNASVIPRKKSPTGEGNNIQKWDIGSSAVELSPQIQKLRELLAKLNHVIEEAPPDTGPRRFGNISFRKWYEIVEDRLPSLLQECLPSELLRRGGATEGGVTAEDELTAYLVGSFGSAQRLDYGSGHELSFLAFLGCIWKLGGFAGAEAGVEERGIALGVIHPYFELIRRLIIMYNLEPAGSHGVWGLDDHSFLPYILGSAQLSPPISDISEIAKEGSISDAPDPTDIARASAVERERKTNLYFDAIGFINEVKKGPFWEHSPILYDISGVKTGWAKINKGLLKMYNAEVLSKFPVVQHFPFGSLFKWERDPDAMPVQNTVHTSSQPSKTANSEKPTSPPMRNPMAEGTKPSWVSTTVLSPGSSSTQVPWPSKVPSRSAGSGSAASANSTVRGAPPPTTAPWTKQSGTNQAYTAMAPTQAPWAAASSDTAPLSVTDSGGVAQTAAPWARPAATGHPPASMPSTRAPWAKDKPPG